MPIGGMDNSEEKQMNGLTKQMFGAIIADVTINGRRFHLSYRNLILTNSVNSPLYRKTCNFSGKTAAKARPDTSYWARMLFCVLSGFASTFDGHDKYSCLFYAH